MKNLYILKSDALNIYYKNSGDYGVLGIFTDKDKMLHECDKIIKYLNKENPDALKNIIDADEHYTGLIYYKIPASLIDKSIDQFDETEEDYSIYYDPKTYKCFTK